MSMLRPCQAPTLPKLMSGVRRICSQVSTDKPFFLGTKFTSDLLNLPLLCYLQCLQCQPASTKLGPSEQYALSAPPPPHLVRADIQGAVHLHRVSADDLPSQTLGQLQPHGGLAHSGGAGDDDHLVWRSVKKCGKVWSVWKAAMPQMRFMMVELGHS